MRTEKLRILASYGIKNDLAWVLRDVLQNFYDGARKNGNKNPFDEIDVSFHRKGDFGTMLVSGNTFFDVAYLLFMGATTKAGDSSQIGEKGEGIKVSTLLAMRDYGLSVVYSSLTSGKGWEAKAVWNYVQIGGGEDRELCFEIREFPEPMNTKDMTNLVFEGPWEIISQLKEMDYKSWFADASNVVLKNRITDEIYAAKKGQGRVFLAGLDRGLDHRLSFTYRVDTKLRNDNDRDRKVLSHNALMEALVLILSKKDVPEEVYSKVMGDKRNEIVNYHTYDPECQALQGNKNFGDYFLDVFGSSLERFTYSENDFYTMQPMQILERLGVRQVTHPTIRDILVQNNVKSIEVLIDGVRQAQEVKVTETLKRKLEILDIIIRKSAIPNKLPIKVFVPSREESHILGTYNETYVRLNKKLFEANVPLSKVLSVYVHELAHVAGADGTHMFSDRLTDYLGYMLGYGLPEHEQPIFLRSIKNYTEQWAMFTV